VERLRRLVGEFDPFGYQVLVQVLEQGFAGSRRRIEWYERLPADSTQ